MPNFKILALACNPKLGIKTILRFRSAQLGVTVVFHICGGVVRRTLPHRSRGRSHLSRLPSFLLVDGDIYENDLYTFSWQNRPVLSQDIVDLSNQLTGCMVEASSGLVQRMNAPLKDIIINLGQTVI